MDRQQFAIDQFGVETTYEVGRGAESLAEAVRKLKRSQRERILVVAADFRLFGDSQKAIFDTTAMLESEGIKIVDATQPKTPVATLTKQGISALASFRRWNDIPEGQRRRAASSGGKAKREHQEAKRAEVAHPDVIRRAIERITWNDFEHIFGISRATARRNY